MSGCPLNSLCNKRALQARFGVVIGLRIFEVLWYEGTCHGAKSHTVGYPKWSLAFGTSYFNGAVFLKGNVQKLPGCLFGGLPFWGSV